MCIVCLPNNKSEPTKHIKTKKCPFKNTLKQAGLLQEEYVLKLFGYVRWIVTCDKVDLRKILVVLLHIKH